MQHAETVLNVIHRHWRAGCGESRTSGSGEGRRKSAPVTRGNSPAAYPTRRGGGAHGGLRADTHHLPAPPGAQVEAGGGADGARRPGRHRRVHHRPGAASAPHRLRPAVRGDEPGEGQIVVPLEGRRHRAVGRVHGQAGSGRGDGGALPHPLLPRLHGAGDSYRLRRAGRMLLPSLQTIQRASSSYQNGSPLPPVHCRRWDISHEQLVWTFMLVNYAKWYSFTTPQRPSFPPPLTSQIVLSNCISDHIPLGPRYRYVGVAQRLLYRNRCADEQPLVSCF